jgi:hypothetical protein
MSLAADSALAPPFRFRRQARNLSTAVTLGVIWLALVLAWLFWDAAWWIIGFLEVFTLPALVDLIRNPASGLDLDSDTLSWFSGRRQASIPRREIDHLRLDTRLDFSVRASVVLETGRRIRLPFESTPPHQAFENALTAQGIKVRRTHFQLRQ